MKSLALAALATLALAGIALAQDHVPPPAVTIGVAAGHSTAVVTWISPGDQCTNATCAEYELRYSTSAITECNFSSATPISTSSPQGPGNEECAGLTSLSCNSTYYFALRTKDSSGNWSVLSNVVTKTTKACNIYTEFGCE